jgi:leader peptidase (prepilin peptidase)/N-methyltransferase
MKELLLVPLAYLAAVSVPLAVTDAREHRLPNALVLPGLALSLWAAVGVGMRDPPLLLAASAAALAAAALFGAGRMLGAVGMGDVKLGVLLAGLATATDARALVPATLATAVLLASVAFGSMGAGGWPQPAPRMPLGPPLLAGFWSGLLLVLPAPP